MEKAQKGPSTMRKIRGLQKEHAHNLYRTCQKDYTRGVETVGPVSPVGHGHLRSDSRTVLSDQMSERTPKYLKYYFGYNSACIGPTVKYDL